MRTKCVLTLAFAALLMLFLDCGGSGGGASGSAGDASTDGDLLAGATAPTPTGSPTDVSYTDASGASVTISAMPGEVLVWMQPAAFGAIRAAAVQLGANVIGQLPAFGVFLADVGAGKEDAFIGSMRAHPEVSDAFPNLMVGPTCTTTVPPDVMSIDASEPKPIPMPTIAAQLDFFDAPLNGLCFSHGEAVDCFLDGRYGSQPPVAVTKIHIAGSAVPDMPTAYTFVFDVARLIQGAKNRPGPAVINVSLGPAQESPASYALFFYELYEMLALLSPETRNRITVVVAAGNAGIALGPALAAARAVAAKVDPDAAKHVLIAGGLDTNGAQHFNTSNDPNDMLCAPADNVSCPLSASQNTGPLSGTSFAAPQYTGLLSRLAANPKYAALGSAGWIKAVENAATCPAGQPSCSCKTIPTLDAAEKAADALLTQPDAGPCTPSCAGKQCGDDTCGGSCGLCPLGQVCNAGACTPDDAGPTDPCGVTGNWSSSCPLGSASCSACGTSSADTSYTITAAIASSGGAWSEGGVDYSYSPANCELTKSFSVNNACFSGTRTYQVVLSGGSGTYAGDFTCWTGSTCNCTGQNPCTETKL